MHLGASKYFKAPKCIWRLTLLCRHTTEWKWPTSQNIYIVVLFLVLKAISDFCKHISYFWDTPETSEQWTHQYFNTTTSLDSGRTVVYVLCICIWYLLAPCSVPWPPKKQNPWVCSSCNLARRGTLVGEVCFCFLFFAFVFFALSLALQYHSVKFFECVWELQSTSKDPNAFEVQLVVVWSWNY